MSFFLGLAKGFTWAQDKKQEKEMFEAQMAWEREKILLSSKLSRQNAGYTSRLKKQEDTEEKIKMIAAMTGNPDVAQKLYEAGMLDTVIANLSREDVDSRAYLRNIAEGLMSSYGNDPEKLAAGLAAASEQDGADAAAVAAASATSSMEDLMEVMSNPPIAFTRTDENDIQKDVVDFLARRGSFSSINVTTNPMTGKVESVFFDDKTERETYEQAYRDIFSRTRDEYAKGNITWGYVSDFISSYGSDYLGSSMETPPEAPPTVTPNSGPPPSTGVLTPGVVPTPESSFRERVFQ